MRFADCGVGDGLAHGLTSVTGVHTVQVPYPLRVKDMYLSAVGIEGDVLEVAGCGSKCFRVMYGTFGKRLVIGNDFTTDNREAAEHSIAGLKFVARFVV